MLLILKNKSGFPIIKTVIFIALLWLNLIFKTEGICLTNPPNATEIAIQVLLLTTSGKKENAHKGIKITWTLVKQEAGVSLSKPETPSIKETTSTIATETDENGIARAIVTNTTGHDIEVKAQDADKLKPAYIYTVKAP